MKMHYSAHVKAQMNNRKPRKKVRISKSTIENFVVFNVWFLGFTLLLYLGFTM